MDGWMIWCAGGLVLMALEVHAPGAFMLWIGLAALGTGLVTWGLALPFAGEVSVFAVLTVVLVVLGLALRRHRRPSGINAPGSGLVGRSATALGFVGSEGRVRLGDSDWPARMVEGAGSPAPRQVLEVVAVDGLVLLVRPAEMTQA
jgi:hypothetical protein